MGEAYLASSQFSFQHMKAFGSHNHLLKDSYNDDHVYWPTSDGSIIHADVSNVNI